MTAHFTLPAWLMRLLGVRPLDCMETAKDCPYCGGESRVGASHQGYQVVCLKTYRGQPLVWCGMRGPEQADVKSAIAAWNRLVLK